MRVYFDHQEKARLFRANELQVTVSVYFTEAEQAVIDEYGLHHLIVLPRRPSVYRDQNGDRQEIDYNIYLGPLVKYAHVETVASPTHAAAFENELLQSLDQLKVYLEGSFSRPTSKVFEL